MGSICIKTREFLRFEYTQVSFLSPFCQTEHFSSYLLEEAFYHYVPTKPNNNRGCSFTCSSSQRRIKCSHKTPTCIGETAAAGGVFMGLGLRGVRGIVAAAGLGTSTHRKETIVSTAPHCNEQGDWLHIANTLLAFYITGVTRSHLLKFQLVTACKIIQKFAYTFNPL